MAEFKVDTSALRSQTTEIQTLQNSLNEVALKLTGMQLGSILRIKASSALIAKITDCKWAVIHQAGDLRRLAKGIDSVAEIYDNIEMKLTEPSTGVYEIDSIVSDYINKWFKDILISKSYVLPILYSLISPVVSYLILDSGLFVGSSDSDSANTSTAWVGKASAEAQNDWGYANVNAYLCKSEVDAKAEAGLLKAKTKKEYKDGKWEEKEQLAFLFAKASAGASAAILAGDAKAAVGDDMLGLEGKLEGSVASVRGKVEGTLSVGEDGVNAYLKGEAIVAAVEGKASGTINILGIEITGEVGGYAGAAGVEGKIGIEDGKFVIKGGAAALIGGSAGIEIGFNEEGWDNFVDFVDFITFWD